MYSVVAVNCASVDVLLLSKMTCVCERHICKSPDVPMVIPYTEHCVCNAPYTVVVPEHWLFLLLSARQFASFL